ncbi:F-actin-monooxygenase MICAL3 [Ischnura elegans]|uniref:F-actin-monooxygenase MICAL3 n=1 Tax=Ischnura elegans TaxID=197161 RepID=UPI001ED899AF|nr:F-actin-monooxygenase MICAL3 [Ischnura elegans]
MGTRSPSRGGLGAGGEEAPGAGDAGAGGGGGRRPGEGLRPRTPSEGREVRCACQYFQTDSLLPERSALAALWKHQHHRTMGDHEYEPVAAPPPRPAPPPVFLGWEADEDPEEMKRRLETTDSGGREQLERQFLHSGLDDDPGPPPVDGAGEEEAMEEIQGTPPSPSPPSLSRTPTTESRTDCELTTSQVDSSGLEELPLRRGARGAGAQKGGVGPITSTIKRKIRNQAGRLRTKMRSIPRPTFKVPEGLMRVGGKGGGGIAPPSATPESTTAASTTQDSASSAADTMERQPRAEKKRTAAQLFDFRTYPRIFERKLKARGEFFSKRASSSGNEDSAAGIGGGAPPRKKMPFGTRWAHRFSDIRYADDEDGTGGGSPAQENGSTSSLRGSAPGGSWSGGSVGGQEASSSAPDGGRPGVLEEIDADEFFLREKGLSRDDVRRGEEISSEIRDALRPQATTTDDELEEVEGRMRRAEEQRRRREQEEEEEEMEEEMEMEEDEEEMVEVEMTPPTRPSRRSTSTSRHVVIDQGFMTFPPQRPFRRKGKIVRAAECEDIAPRAEDEEEEEMEDEEPQRWRNGRPVVIDGAIMAENLVRNDWEEGWGRKEHEEPEEEEKVLTEGVMAEGGRERMGGLEAEEEAAGDGGWRGYVGERLRGWLGDGGGEEDKAEPEEAGSREVEEVANVEVAPPMPPKRRRRAPYENSAVSLDDSRCISTEEVRMEEFDRSSTNVSLKQHLSESAQLFPQVTITEPLTSPDPEYASPSRDLAPPVAPRRTRSLPRRSKEKEEEPSPVLPRMSTSVPPRPQRRHKMPEFFTVPRRKPKKPESPPPQRPARSGYATPGPPKAPVRRRPSTPLPASIPPSEDMGIESGEERVKELTAGEVVSKMRARPLPPPPRPPRRERARSAERSSWEEVVEGHLTLGSDRAPESITSAKSLTDHDRIPPEEVSIAIQTDPLPYEYCMEDGALEESAPPTGSEQTSEVLGRRSPMTWPTPPPTPPPTARRQRRQAASRRAAAASEREPAGQMERPAEIEQHSTIPAESILAESSPPAERRVPTPVEHRVPTPVEQRVPTPAEQRVPAPSEEVPRPPPPTPAAEERLAEDAPPSIPPLPAVIPVREQPVESPSPPAPAPQEHPAPVAVSSPPPPPVPPAPSVEAQPPMPEPPRPVLVTERHVKAVEEVIEPQKEISQLEQTPTPAEIPPVAPPRPPKPIPKPAETPPTPQPPSDETVSIPPPSFQQLRSPEEPAQTVPAPPAQTAPVPAAPVQQPQATEPSAQQPTVQQQMPMMPPQYPYSIPPPYFFPPPPSTEDSHGTPMPPAPNMGAVALLCVGEISARKLVVSEFQSGWGPRDSQDSSSSPPRETRRSTGGRGSSETGGRRRMPSVPTARRRPPPRRSQSESGAKEGKEGKEDFEDPEDPELPGIGELSGRLARACGNAAVSTVRQLLLTAVERVEGDGRTEAAIIIALVMAVALVVLTMGHTRQGHRWDFYLPPAP